LTPTVCSEDEYMLHDYTATTDRLCAGLTVCQPGEFVAVKSTITADRICGDCALGVDFSSSVNAAACTAVTQACGAFEVETAGEEEGAM